MSDSVSIAFTNFENVVRLLKPGEPKTNGPSFDVLDWARTADAIDIAAKNLNALLSTFNQSVPGFQRLSQQTRADAQEIVDHTFWRG